VERRQDRCAHHRRRHQAEEGMSLAQLQPHVVEVCRLERTTVEVLQWGLGRSSLGREIEKLRDVEKALKDKSEVLCRCSR